ncbi:MAG: hypothetical protein U9O97_01855, partial [Elusimicrobiota bacterium]|nr:hypothetical protein [Elusimicrobiota bacterium]
MTYIAGLGSEITDMIYEDGTIYAVNNKLWQIDAASGFSVVIVTNNCSYQSIIVCGDKFYLSDEYGFLREYNSITGEMAEIGSSALGMTDIAYYSGAVFAVSRDKCL